ncbi:MAG: YcxB family protein [Lachnospiraceae bacterium]|nr:YcxB family protein [Lachnospiraceae bacterium]
MYYAYASYLAVVNIICIASSIALIIALWRTAPGWLRTGMLLFLSLFTVVQPLFLYLHSRAMVKGKTEELELRFHENGLEIKADGAVEHHPWKDILSVSVKPTLLVVYTGENRGYILTNRVLGASRKDLLSFIREKRTKEMKK